MRDDVTKLYGIVTKDRIKDRLQEIEDKGIVIIISSSRYPDSTIVQIAKNLSYNRYKHFIINVDPDEYELEDIYNQVVKYINNYIS